MLLAGLFNLNQRLHLVSYLPNQGFFVLLIIKSVSHLNDGISLSATIEIKIIKNRNLKIRPDNGPASRWLQLTR